MRFQPFSEAERLGLLAGPHMSLAGGVVGGVMEEIQLGVLKPESSVMLSELVQLLLGLSSLVLSTTLVVGHPFGLRQRKTPLRR